MARPKHPIAIRLVTPDPKAEKRMEIRAAIRTVLQDGQPLGKNELAASVGYGRNVVLMR